MLYRNDTSQNYELKDGDQLSIPEGLNLFIKVQGKVQAPGLYPYKEPMTLADAISQARGEVVGRSRLSKTLVIRQKPGQPGQYTYINADYVKFIRKGDITQNIELQPGDLIYVPETNTPDFQQITSLANVFFILTESAAACSDFSSSAKPGHENSWHRPGARAGRLGGAGSTGFADVAGGIRAHPNAPYRDAASAPSDLFRSNGDRGEAFACRVGD